MGLLDSSSSSQTVVTPAPAIAYVPAPPLRLFETGATRDTDAGKPDYEGFLSPAVLVRYGEYMTEHRKQKDGSLRDSDNWQRGIARSSYVKSLLRHVFDVWLLQRGITRGASTSSVQEALCAVMFNAMGLLHEIQLGRGDGT